MALTIGRSVAHERMRSANAIGRTSEVSHAYSLNPSASLHLARPAAVQSLQITITVSVARERPRERERERESGGGPAAVAAAMKIWKGVRSVYRVIVGSETC